MGKTQHTEHTLLAISQRGLEELPRPGLMALPVELIVEICTFLCWHCQSDNNVRLARDSPERARSGQAALSRLSRTCKLLRALAEPFLFHRIHLSKVSGFRLFVRALLERPELRLKVCEVTDITPPGIFRFKSANGEPIAGLVEDALISGDWASLSSALMSAETAVASTPCTNAERFAALSSLLLHLAPNLASASFFLGNTLPFECLRALTRWNAAVPAKSLRRLSLAPFRPFTYEEFPGFCLDNALYILQAAPTLEVLHLHDCTFIPEYPWSFFGQTLMSMPLRLENLTELILTDCYVTSTYLSNLTKALGPNLSRVIIRKSGGRVHMRSIELEDILQTLRPWNQTLQELTYRFLSCSQQEEGVDVPPEPLSLPAFRSLEVLDVATDTVDFYLLEHQEGALANCLPPSLRKLSLAGDAYLTLVMEGILDARVSGRLPHLAVIELNQQDDWDDSVDLPDQDREMIEAVAGLRSAGVRIVVHPLRHEF